MNIPAEYDWIGWSHFIYSFTDDRNECHRPGVNTKLFSATFGNSQRIKVGIYRLGKKPTHHTSTTLGFLLVVQIFKSSVSLLKTKGGRRARTQKLNSTPNPIDLRCLEGQLQCIEDSIFSLPLSEMWLLYSLQCFLPCWCEPSVMLPSFPPIFCWWGHSDSMRTSQRILEDQKTVLNVTQTLLLQRVPRQDLFVWAYPARSASCYERKVQNTAFLFSFISLEILLNPEHNLGLGFLSIQKFDTTTRNTHMSHGMQTFSQGSDFNWTIWHSLFTSSHQSFIEIWLLIFFDRSTWLFLKWNYFEQICLLLGLFLCFLQSYSSSSQSYWSWD